MGPPTGRPRPGPNKKTWSGSLQKHTAPGAPKTRDCSRPLEDRLSQTVYFLLKRQSSRLVWFLWELKAAAEDRGAEGLSGEERQVRPAASSPVHTLVDARVVALLGYGERCWNEHGCASLSTSRLLCLLYWSAVTPSLAFAVQAPARLVLRLPCGPLDQEQWGPPRALSQDAAAASNSAHLSCLCCHPSPLEKEGTGSSFCFKRYGSLTAKRAAPERAFSCAPASTRTSPPDVFIQGTQRLLEAHPFSPLLCLPSPSLWKFLFPHLLLRRYLSQLEECGQGVGCPHPGGQEAPQATSTAGSVRHYAPSDRTLTICDSTTSLPLALRDLSAAFDLGGNFFLQHLSFGLWLCALSLTCLPACHCTCFLRASFSSLPLKAPLDSVTMPTTSSPTAFFFLRFYLFI
ncbi:uncharacterized protein [Callorhinus ursinus]|uniref:uncharacterized protein n=1 Tax=Callorhinus ursinus TaxID=34884 RepID=UPI003CD038CF